MDKKKIKKEYDNKIQNLIKLNKHYYEFSKPLVDDQEYYKCVEIELFQSEGYFNFRLSSEPNVTYTRIMNPENVTYTYSWAWEEED